MSLRQSGYWCDVCNSPMVIEMLEGYFPAFKVSASPTEMHYHEKCKELLVKALESKDEKLLPNDSPLGDLIVRVREHNAKQTPAPRLSKEKE